MIYFTSDLHLGHNKSFVYEARGFPSIGEHDETIIQNWNNIITEEDDVYILGDLMLNDNEHGLECLRQLNGHLHFVIGNHDTPTRIKLYEEAGLINEGYATVIKYRKYYFYLSHYPTVTTNGKVESLHQVTLNLSGHTHSPQRFCDKIPFLFNVALDANYNTPISLDEIIELMKQRFDTIKNLL